MGGCGPGESTDDEHPPVFMSHHIRKPTGMTRLGSLDHLLTQISSPAPSQTKRSASANAAPMNINNPNGLFVQRNPMFITNNGANGTEAQYPQTNDKVQAVPLQFGFIRHQPGVSQIVYPHQINAAQISQDQSVKHKKNSTDPVVIGPLILGELQHFAYNIYQDQNKVMPVFQQSYLLPPQSNPQQRVEHQLSQSQIEQMQDFARQHNLQNNKQERVRSDEYWVDGPRISKSKVAASKVNAGRPETWIDGPTSGPGPPFSYGFMDEHKKLMIAQWVEVQSAQVIKNANKSPHRKEPTKYHPDTHSKTSDDYEESNNDSDVETLSEEPTNDINLIDSLKLSSETSQPQDTERKSSSTTPLNAPCEQQVKRDSIMKEGQPGRPPDEPKVAETSRLSSPETLAEDEPSIDDICSQCEALAEEYEELSSLLSCEEEECKRQAHQGLGE